MNGPKNVPKISDVAAIAGVSTATVSRYFTRPNLVADSTAARIKKAVDELGYLPNLVAGGLASNRTRLISIMLPGLAHLPINTFIEDVSAGLADQGYTTMLGVARTDEDLRKAIDASLARRVDGIILSTDVRNQEARERLRAAQITVIETWGLPVEPIDCAVGFSHAEAGRATAEYVHQRGYANPVVVTSKHTLAAERRRAFIEQWRTLTDKPVQDIEIEGDSDFGRARSVFRQIVRLQRRPDVVVCGGDGIAVGLAVEAKHAGIVVPDEIAIVGFGNHPISASMRPSITTVAIDGKRIASEAANLILGRSEGRFLSETVINVGFQIIERESA